MIDVILFFLGLLLLYFLFFIVVYYVTRRFVLPQSRMHRTYFETTPDVHSRHYVARDLDESSSESSSVDDSEQPSELEKIEAFNEQAFESKNPVDPSVPSHVAFVFKDFDPSDSNFETFANKQLQVLHTLPFGMSFVDPNRTHVVQNVVVESFIDWAPESSLINYNFDEIRRNLSIVLHKHQQSFIANWSNILKSLIDQFAQNLEEKDQNPITAFMDNLLDQPLTIAVQTEALLKSKYIHNYLNWLYVEWAHRQKHLDNKLSYFFWVTTAHFEAEISASRASEQKTSLIDVQPNYKDKLMQIFLCQHLARFPVLSEQDNLSIFEQYVTILYNDYQLFLQTMRAFDLQHFICNPRFLNHKKQTPKLDLWFKKQTGSLVCGNMREMNTDGLYYIANERKLYVAEIQRLLLLKYYLLRYSFFGHRNLEKLSKQVFSPISQTSHLRVSQFDYRTFLRSLFDNYIMSYVRSFTEMQKDTILSIQPSETYQPYEWHSFGEQIREEIPELQTHWPTFKSNISRLPVHRRTYKTRYKPQNDYQKQMSQMYSKNPILMYSASLFNQIVDSKENTIVHIQPGYIFTATTVLELFNRHLPPLSFSLYNHMIQKFLDEDLILNYFFDRFDVKLDNLVSNLTRQRIARHSSSSEMINAYGNFVIRPLQQYVKEYKDFVKIVTTDLKRINIRDLFPSVIKKVLQYSQSVRWKKPYILHDLSNMLIIITAQSHHHVYYNIDYSDIQIQQFEYYLQLCDHVHIDDKDSVQQTINHQLNFLRSLRPATAKELTNLVKPVSSISFVHNIIADFVGDSDISADEEVDVPYSPSTLYEMADRDKPQLLQLIKNSADVANQDQDRKENEDEKENKDEKENEDEKKDEKEDEDDSEGGL